MESFQAIERFIGVEGGRARFSTHEDSLLQRRSARSSYMGEEHCIYIKHYFIRK